MDAVCLVSGGQLPAKQVYVFPKPVALNRLPLGIKSKARIKGQGLDLGYNNKEYISQDLVKMFENKCTINNVVVMGACWWQGSQAQENKLVKNRVVK